MHRKKRLTRLERRISRPESGRFLITLMLIELLVVLVVSVVRNASSAEPAAPFDQTLEAIGDCMACSPAPWPDEWNQQYLETIRRVVESHQDVPHFALRLEILCKGFTPYWDGLTKSDERFSFVVHRAQIRWYIEHLMSTKFPTDQERQKLRNQYKDIWNFAAGSLLVQFPFLDPNAVEKAKADDLSQCYYKIDAPLMPDSKPKRFDAPHLASCASSCAPMTSRRKD